MDETRLSCPCTRSKCKRHGNCSACREYHQLKGTILPTCDRLKQKEERKAAKNGANDCS